MDEKEKRIRNWILKNGYPFEMQIARLFQKNGFKISQSVLYRDIDTNKYREIDILAYHNKVVNGVSFSFSFVIECKKSNDKPWIVFKNTDLINNKLNRFKAFATNNAHLLIHKTKANKTLKNVFPSLEDAGYNIVIAFKESKDLAYSSTTSLIKACKYIVNKFNKSELKQCNIYIPVIAIEGNLYDAYLDIDGEISFKEVEKSSIMNTKVFDEEEFSNLIRIVSSSNIEKYITLLKTEINEFFKNYDFVLKEISKSNPTNNDYINSINLGLF
jgi:hypothetical protein